MRLRWYFHVSEQGRWEATTDHGGFVVTDEVSHSIIIDLQTEADTLRQALEEIVGLKDADEDPGYDMVRIATAALEATA